MPALDSAHSVLNSVYCREAPDEHVNSHLLSLRSPRVTQSELICYYSRIFMTLNSRIINSDLIFYQNGG